MMEKDVAQLLNTFMKKARADPRIGPAHISLYVALLTFWYDNDGCNPLYVFSHEIMRLCKLSGLATYHRSIKELDEYGYIKYVPSYNHFLGSLVYFTTSQNICLVDNK